MSATNQTAVYGLPIFLGTDVPSWLTDWNGAMGDIDTAIAAAKAAADAAASTAGTAATDIVTINGQITSLQNTVGTHTTQIGTISGNINTINSLIGNGTPTTTDQTIIGAINELHADQGDLADLTTTDKSSLVAAINEAAQSGGGGGTETVRYYNGWIQYSTDNGQTWVNWINTVNPTDLIPVLTSNTSSPMGTASGTSNQQAGTEAYKGFTSAGFKLQNASDYVEYTFATGHAAVQMVITFESNSSNSTAGDVKVQYTEDGNTWADAGANTVTAENATETLTFNINATVTGIRAIKQSSAGMFTVTNFNVKG